MDCHCTGKQGTMSDVLRKMARRASEATAISPRHQEGPGVFTKLQEERGQELDEVRTTNTRASNQHEVKPRMETSA